MKRNNTKKKVKFFWPKLKKGKGFVTNKVDKSTILVNGLLLTCIGLSISSGIVDIVCYSGLSKSFFHLGTIPLPAAILYTVISVFMTSAKFWCGMKIGMLKELRTHLKAQNKTWYENITKALVPWQIAHKFLIAVSLLTAMSMSTNSIGTGIRKMQQNIDNMTKDAQTLIDLNNSVNNGVKDKREAARSNISGAISAKDDAKQEVDRYYGRLVKYQEEYNTISDNPDLTDEEKEVQHKDIIDKIVKEIPGTTTRNALYFNKADLQKSIQKTASANETVDDGSLYEEAVAYDKQQIEITLLAIADKDYKLPNGEELIFVNEDGTPVNVQLAISRLQNGISAWQTDTGDVGESSRVFTLLATYIHADVSAGGMGPAEFMMMIFIFFTGIIQEFLIALCTPSATIDRKTLLSVARYCEWESNEEKQLFLLDVYMSYMGDGVFTREEYEEKCKECVELSEETRQDIIDKYSKKKKNNDSVNMDFTTLKNVINKAKETLK